MPHVDATRNDTDSHSSGKGVRGSEAVGRDVHLPGFHEVQTSEKLTGQYCPRNEMKKLEAELWNLKVIEESDKIERYVGGLPDMIHGNIVASKPKTMQEAIEMATKLMDKRVSTMAERQVKTRGS
ncbi:hypothetical protein Tco_1066390 [Tanacetum coccineum]|uniref:Reverse transcriptase domain-containing protein n=1 Tax=Tanacetum coccineum TaxID=301880 RepID=A0ABQ5E156_9ASTR